MLSYFVLFFFFKQKTAYEMRISDWSSDVCSSDLQQFGALGQVELVVGTEVQDAVFQHQRYGIAHVGPKGFHLAASDLERALGGNRGEAEITGPVELPAVGTYGHQCHVGMAVGQCAEVLQLEIDRKSVV